VGESLPVWQQSLSRQAVRDLDDLALAVAGLEGEAPASRRNGLQHLQRVCPQALQLELPLATGLFPLSAKLS
jgi:hypothetical protein